MILIRANEGNVYEAKNHFNMWGIRKFGPPDGAKSLNVSISEFLPDGGALLTASDKERVYYVLRGSITVKDANGAEYIMGQDDMIYIAPGELRDMAVNGTVAARVLVIIANA